MRSEGENKKILFYYSKFNVGGAEKSTLRLITLLVEKGWKVTLLLRYAHGTMEHLLPKEVRVIHLAKECYPAIIAAQTHAVRKLLKTARYAVPYALQRLSARKTLQRLHREAFSMAVVGLQGLDPRVVVEDIDAQVRLLWIRNDMLHCDPDGHVSKNIKQYGDRIDWFPCVSGTAYESFCATFPEYKEKAMVFYNVINAAEMRALAEAPCELDGQYTDALKMITVCRISDKAKGVFRMLEVYKRLREEGFFFYWIVVGDGPDLPELQKRVKEYGLDDGFIMLGRRENPFPLYKYCDVSATLSYYEGLCGTVNEAKIVGLPVIATEFSGIHEQIQHGQNGWILDNNEEAVFEGLKTILSDPRRITSVKNNVLPEAIANDDSKEKRLADLLREKRACHEK